VRRALEEIGALAEVDRALHLAYRVTADSVFVSSYHS
jgi:hypothetical protein